MKTVEVEKSQHLAELNSDLLHLILGIEVTINFGNISNPMYFKKLDRVREHFDPFLYTVFYCIA